MIPANVYPILTVIQFGQGAPSTILGGISHLIEDGLWGLAMIIFIASIVVPVTKLIVLSFLLLTVQYKSNWRSRDRTFLYRVTEVIGAWSMVDIFLVGLLSSLVSLDALSTIEPGIGATYFAGVVVLTMFAAHSFDSRLIWDNAQKKHEGQS
jgi:paraquat-inducible protein A